MDVNPDTWGKFLQIPKDWDGKGKTNLLHNEGKNRSEPFLVSKQDKNKYGVKA